MQTHNAFNSLAHSQRSSKFEMVAWIAYRPYLGGGLLTVSRRTELLHNNVHRFGWKPQVYAVWQSLQG